MQNLNEFYAYYIIKGAKIAGQRTGQWLFNRLPTKVAALVAGQAFDPFSHDMTEREITEWLDNHLIFDHNEIVGLFDNNELLWVQ